MQQEEEGWGDWGGKRLSKIKLKKNLRTDADEIILFYDHHIAPHG